MYSEWVSIPVSSQAEDNRWSVLHKLPNSAGRDVVVAVVKPLAALLGISTANCEPSTLCTEKEVQWCMEVICYGLSLPLTEHEAIRDCVSIYCEWLLAMSKPKICVPKPVCQNANMYARKIIQHLFNLFISRLDDNSDIISRQAVLCHRVLRTLETLAHESEIIERQTWNALLLFLLAINDTLLSPPSIQTDDISSKLGERILSVLFKVWLLACHRCFPSPPLWKTFRELCCSWRHRVVLVDQWNQVNAALTARLQAYIYGQTSVHNKIIESDSAMVPKDMNHENLTQTWFRFLHTLGNPMDLSRPEIISQTAKFYHYALSSEMVVDPCQHPCLTALPFIFYKAMHGLAILVDSFLGFPSDVEGSQSGKPSTTLGQPSATPPHNRKTGSNLKPPSTATKNPPRSSIMSGFTSRTSSNASPSQLPPNPPPPPPTNPSVAFGVPIFSYQRGSFLSPSRPKCNSILHLFGAWLFEATLNGSGMSTRVTNKDPLRRRSNSLVMEAPLPSSMPDCIEIPAHLTVAHFEWGQAEAIGTLCRLFSAKRTGEEILPIYLARFYLAMQYGLSGGKEHLGLVTSSILSNSCDLLKIDLDGVMILLPNLLSALELVLPEKEIKLIPEPTISKVDLRSSSIQLLLSMLPLPLHFRDLTTKEFSKENISPSFASLRPRLMNLLINSLQVENDPNNIHMLLGGLLQCIQDSAAVEEVDQFAEQSEESESAAVEVPLPSLSSQNSLSSQDSFQANNLGADSAYSLFVRAIYLLCHRLISTWNSDLNISLAALEVLSGLARIHFPQDAQECKRAVRWICDYIVHQCSRPPPSHSKDLHSTIVAAYQCVTTWLVERPDLLKDKESLHIVLEVIELGISGSKSQGKPGIPLKLKADKELKPASMRVKDAAEGVLLAISDHVGHFPTLSGPESLSTLLEEESLLQHCNSWKGAPFSRDQALKHFRYFVVDNSFILALLEQHLGNDQDPQPSVTALIRGPFGMHAWEMQLRHLPRKSRTVVKTLSNNLGRPELTREETSLPVIQHKYFPESVLKIPPCQAESSIPTLESLIGENLSEHNKMKAFIENQTKKEREQNETANMETPEFRQPEMCQEFQTARLLIPHLGFMTLESLRETIMQPLPSLMFLDATKAGFASQLDALDSISNRNFDTAFVFYVQSGQKDPNQILANVLSSNHVSTVFLEFLLSLGWPVEVSKHSGWTGHISTSFNKVSAQPRQISDSYYLSHGGSLYNGLKQVLYWSDATTEIAFVVPSLREQTEKVNQDLKKSKGDGEEHENHFNLSSNFENDGLTNQGSQGRSSGRKFGKSSNVEAKIMIVWLENYEDYNTFPLEELLVETETGVDSSCVRSQHNYKDVYVIFIHTLKNGLLRIKMQGPSGKMSLALPLCDGMVISNRILGTLVRQTAINLARRRRLDADNSILPHVRRKYRIQEVVESYCCRLSEAEFYTKLFVSTQSTP